MTIFEIKDEINHIENLIKIELDAGRPILKLAMLHTTLLKSLIAEYEKQAKSA